MSRPSGSSQKVLHVSDQQKTKTKNGKIASTSILVLVCMQQLNDRRHLEVPLMQTRTQKNKHKQILIGGGAI